MINYIKKNWIKLYICVWYNRIYLYLYFLFVCWIWFVCGNAIPQLWSGLTLLCINLMHKRANSMLVYSRLNSSSAGKLLNSSLYVHQHQFILSNGEAAQSSWYSEQSRSCNSLQHSLILPFRRFMYNGTTYWEANPRCPSPNWNFIRIQYSIERVPFSTSVIKKIIFIKKYFMFPNIHIKPTKWKWLKWIEWSEPNSWKV